MTISRRALAVLLLLCGCGASSGSASPPQPPDTRYYASEVLPPDLLGAYGHWTFDGHVNGCVSPPADFEELVLAPYGVFACLTGTTTVTAGHLELSESPGGTRVTLVADDTYAEDVWPLVVYQSAVAPPLFMSIDDHGGLWLAGYNDAGAFRFTRRSP